MIWPKVLAAHVQMRPAPVRAPRILGFGTAGLEVGERCEESVLLALHLGYRLIDTARSYANEACVGAAIVRSGVARKEMTIITKIHPEEYLVEGAVDVMIADSLAALHTEYIDYVLLHQPPSEASGNSAHAIAAWSALSAHRSAGRVRGLGASNFPVEELVQLRKAAEEHGLAPLEMVQAKWSVFHRGFFFNPDGVSLPNFCQKYGVKLLGFRALHAEGHSPPIIKDPHIVAVATELGESVTPAMVALRWALQSLDLWGVLAASTSSVHIKENWRVQADMPDLSDAQWARLDGLAGLLRSPLNRPDRGGLSCNVYDV